MLTWVASTEHCPPSSSLPCSCPWLCRSFTFYSLQTIPAGSCIDDHGQAYVEITNNIDDDILIQRALAVHYEARFREVGRTSRLVAVETSQGPLRYPSTPLDCLSAALYAALDHTLRQLADVSSNEDMIIYYDFLVEGWFSTSD